MEAVTEKRISLRGVQVTASMSSERAQAIKNSLLWRYVARPSLRLLGGAPSVNEAGVVAPDEVRHPEMRTSTWTMPDTAKPPAGPPTSGDPAAMELWDRVSELYWYHAIDLGKGVMTPGLVENQGHVSQVLPADLRGKRCLDVGTFDGFWAFEMEKRGASEVVALDLESLDQMDIRPQSRNTFIDGVMAARGTTVLGQPFALAKEVLGSNVERRTLNVYDLSPDKVGKFDLVHCGDVIPHLRDPQLALENIFSVTREAALLGSAFDPEVEIGDQPLMRVCPSGGDFVWWWFSRASLKLMLTLSGFARVDEVFSGRVDNRAARFWKTYLMAYVQG